MRADIAILFLAGAFMLCSCRYEPPAEADIVLDLSGAEVLDMTAFPMLTVTEMDTAVVMGQVSGASVLDGIAIVKAGKVLYGIDWSTGEVKTRYSRQGRASDEYLSLWAAGADSGLVYIYDMNGKKILFYSADGDFLRSCSLMETSSENPFQEAVRLNDSLYVGKRIYRAGDICELSLYDKDFRYVRDIGDFRLRSGIYMGSPFYRVSDNNILYCRYMLNDIYRLTADTLSVAYRIDFTDKSIPRLKRFKDEYEIIDFVNGVPGKYAGCVSDIYETPEYFCFTFLSDSRQWYAVYDRASGESRVYDLSVPEGMELEKVITADGKVLAFVSGIKGETQLVCCTIEDFVS